MKVVHFTSVHTHTDIRIFHKECVSLVKNGFEVSLVAPGVEDHVDSGVNVLGVRKSSGRLSRVLITTWQVYSRVKSERADIYHFHDPELLPIGLLLTWSGACVIYDAHEDVPRQVLNKHWIPWALRKFVSLIVERLENSIAKRLAGIVTSTPHIAARFRKINVNTIDINNFPVINELAPMKSTHKRKNAICYVGGITKARGIEPLVRALPLIPEVTLILCGRFTEPDFESEMHLLSGWRQVDYRGFVGREEIRRVMAESFAGIVTLLPIVNYLDSQPIKMFEYMSAELPVIASDFPLWRQIIYRAGAGFCVNPQSSEAIAKVIERLMNSPELVTKMGRAGRDAVRAQYNWGNEEKKLLSFYTKSIKK